MDRIISIAGSGLPSCNSVRSEAKENFKTFSKSSTVEMTRYRYRPQCDLEVKSRVHKHIQSSGCFP
jgi:hypothetical protein